MNLIDNIIEYISPELSFKRNQFRAANEVLKRGYEGASRSKRMKGWNTTNGSANTENEFSLKILRNRARDLERNNPWAKKAIKTISNNVVGAGGIRVTCSDKNYHDLFLKWSENKRYIDFNERQKFEGLQKMAMKAVVRDGEVFIRKRRFKNKSGVPLQLQLCESEYVDSDKTILSGNGKGNFIIQGVEFNEAGKRVGYWMYDRHPDDGYGNSAKFVPASEVIHIYVEDRPGQVRGITWLAADIVRLRGFDEYEDATLMRQKIAACFVMTVTDAGMGALPGTNGDDDDDLPSTLSPGRITKLKPGQTVNFGTPPAADGYAEYSRTQLRAIAAGVGLSYEAMTGDLSNVNFSSGRMGWLEMSREVDDIQQNLLINTMCEDIFEWFVEASVIAGRLRENVENRCTWTAPRREMIDPVKETKGILMQIRSGLLTLPEAIRERGYDPDEVLTEISETNKKLDELGLILDSDPRVDIQAEPEPQEPEE